MFVESLTVSWLIGSLHFEYALVMFRNVIYANENVLKLILKVKEFLRPVTANASRNNLTLFNFFTK